MCVVLFIYDNFLDSINYVIIFIVSFEVKQLWLVGMDISVLTCTVKDLAVRTNRCNGNFAPICNGNFAHWGDGTNQHSNILNTTLERKIKHIIIQRLKPSNTILNGHIKYPEKTNQRNQTYIRHNVERTNQTQWKDKSTHNERTNQHSHPCTTLEWKINTISPVSSTTLKGKINAIIPVINTIWKEKSRKLIPC